MTRVEPHTASCSECSALVIDALLAGEPIRLDAAPTPDGLYRAYCDRDGTWRANPSNPTEDSFLGMRRREHVCVIPDRQLELGAA